jgi:hypothetical protein
MKKLREHAEIERGLRRIYGKSKGTLVSNTGATPAPYDAMPDYASIYYQPDDDPRRQDEAAARETQRRAMGIANRGKYGFHGTADPEGTPILRYETDDFPQNPPRRSLASSKRRGVIASYKPPQPVKVGPMPKLVVPKGK